jgi:hypothetical protein
MRNNYDLDVTCNAVTLKEEVQCNISHFNRIFHGGTVPLESFKELFFQSKERIILARKLIQFLGKELPHVQ